MVKMSTDKHFKVMIVSNTAWSILNFRAGLIRNLLSSGYDLLAVAPSDEYVTGLKAIGCRYCAIHMDNKGTNPVRDLLLLYRLYILIRQEMPDVILSYTIKPNIYCSFIANHLKIPVINNIVGLGTVFIREGWLTQLVRGMYRMALSNSERVFFQNEEDRSLFIKDGLVRQEITDRLPGSGIDLERFAPAPPRDGNSTLRFLLIARMLWDKGIGEFVQAARLLKQCGLDVECCMLGFLDVQNPTAISRKQMNAWMEEGVIRYLGVTDDVRPAIASVDCVVLPSYREGVPRSLLEASAMARPIITTDTVGCREVVDDGVNGFLCRPRDAQDLAEKMKSFALLTPTQRAEMGRQGRLKMEREFDEKIVIARYREVISRLENRGQNKHYQRC